MSKLLMLIFISFSVQANELSIDKKEKFESYKEIKKNDENQYLKILKEVQKVLILKDEGFKPQVLNFLSKLNVKIVATGSTFIIIRPLEDIDKNDFNKILDKIKNRDEIKSITSDRIVRKKEESDDITRVCNKDNQKQVSDLVKPLFQITQEASQSKCYMAPHCNDNVNPSWARMQIGADLAEKVVANTLKENKNLLMATVAVIDSGFDFKNQSNAINANSIVVEKGHESSGNPNIDPDGHGTAVSGMVSGNGIGITKNINLRVYRVTEKYATGSTSSAMLAASIEKACEKSDIVNVSWGSTFDELGMSKIENALWYKKAKERGCLVVKSAGNSGVKNAKKQEIPIDAPFISVAASDQFSEEATFSTKGMISAPGAGVYSLLSHHHEYSNSTVKNGCRLNGAAVGPINGTSFSSPILAGVAGQVLTILKSNKAIPADPVKKVSLLKSILLASVKWNRETGSKNNSVNALLATLIASKMTNNNYTLELDKLTDLGKQAAANKCEEQVNDCDTEISCANKRTCADSLRYKIFACVPLSEKVFKYAISSFNSMNEIELIQSLFQRVPANNTLKNKLLTALEKSWELYIEKGSSTNLEKSITVLDKARQKGFKEFITLKKFKQIIYSYSFSHAFNINELVGKNILNGGDESLFPKFILAFKELTIKEQKKLIKKLTNISHIFHDGEYGVLYLLNEEIDSLHPDVQKVLRKKIKKKARKWLKGKLKLSNSIFTYTQNTAMLDMLLKSIPNGKGQLKNKINARNSKSLFNKIKLFFKKNKKVKSQYITYALTSDYALTPNEKNILAKEILTEGISSNEPSLLVMYEKALEVRMLHGNSDEGNNDIKDFLLKNSFSKLSINSFSIFETIATDQQKLLGFDIDFWNEFIKVNISRMNKVLKSKGKMTEYISYVPSSNIFNALSRNGLLPDHIKNKILHTHKKEIKKIIRLAIAKYIQYKNVEILKKGYEIKEGASHFITKIIQNYKKLSKAGLKDDIIKELTVLKDDMEKNPSDYSQSMKHRVYKIFNNITQ